MKVINSFLKQPELGKKVLELRQNRGLTQSELAENCKLSLRTVQRIESADVMPRSYTI
jgi:transcriptional regulator with XRE-family HTH domain